MYHTKPCVVSAFQYDGDLKDAADKFYVPKWASEAYLQGILYYTDWELYLKPEYNDEAVNVPVGNYVILLPNNTMITMDPMAFGWLFESTEDRSDA